MKRIKYIYRINYRYFYIVTDGRQSRRVFRPRNRSSSSIERDVNKKLRGTIRNTVFDRYYI